ncbi:MAG TPA: aspartate--tRNA(Asn) ligase [Clostridiales bacterium]|nr:aspartate--tRNA(Asn) ligase [Clostridiales bacterium]HPP36349.1 aspartate--tRNA(Asn) ligase [Clostridiales bacterium]
MKRSCVADVLANDAQKVLVRGWVHNINRIGKIAFVQLRDRTGIIQIVADDDMVRDLRLEMSIEAAGNRVMNEKAPYGVEILADSIRILGTVYYDMLPFEINRKKIKASLETQLDHRTISLRPVKSRAIFKVQQEIEEVFRNYLKENGFTQIHTPKIISSATEGGSEMFTVDFFGKRAFLAQSPQFYKQMMVGAGIERVFEVGHAYRAELHNTWRHLSEYVSMDVEMGFIESYEDLMDLEEGYINRLFSHLKSACAGELEMFGVSLPDSVEIPRIPLAEAQRIVFEKYGKRSPASGLDAEGEKLFSDYMRNEHGTDFVFLTKYPASKRPMYTMPDPEDPELTQSFDLIYKGLEITTGSQRIHDYEMLRRNIIKFGLDPECFSFYLDSFRYGMPPHGGFAIGLERITMKILDLDNIREAALFPRDIKRLEP